MIVLTPHSVNSICGDLENLGRELANRQSSSQLVDHTWASVASTLILPLLSLIDFRIIMYLEPG